LADAAFCRALSLPARDIRPSSYIPPQIWGRPSLAFVNFRARQGIRGCHADSWCRCLHLVRLIPGIRIRVLDRRRRGAPCSFHLLLAVFFLFPGYYSPWGGVNVPWRNRRRSTCLRHLFACRCIRIRCCLIRRRTYTHAFLPCKLRR
jgi:hypothetical protein